MNRSGGPRQFDDADTEGGKYFTDAADRERNNAGRRVLADATAMKNEMLSNLVLWGAEKKFGENFSMYGAYQMTDVPTGTDTNDMAAGIKFIF
jgi:hypothetical protein